MRFFEFLDFSNYFLGPLDMNGIKTSKMDGTCCAFLLTPNVTNWSLGSNVGISNCEGEQKKGP